MKKIIKFTTLVVCISVLLVIAGQIEVQAKNSQRTYYEIFVRSFYDANGDGVGDIQGIIEKLDYLNDGNPETDDDLGVKGIWLMPITKSNSYHGYGVTDYYQVNPDYGSLEDVKELTKKAHERGMKVIMDLVINHTSSQHPWFLDARKSKDSEYRDYYVWANSNPDGKNKQSAWHNSLVGQYHAVFYRGMPDLNYYNPEVQKEVIDIGQFWLKQGIDGFRLDGAKHIFRYEKHEQNVKWWSKFTEKMQQVDPDAYIVGEVWDKPEVVAKYLECFDSSFNFAVGKKIIEAVDKEQDLGLSTKLQSIYDYYEQNVEADYIDAPFLTNHDQNRVMSQLKNKPKAKLAANIYLTLPGNPFIYYGEEIGMNGTKPDKRIREPFPWYKKDKKGETSWTFAISNLDLTPAEKQQEQSNSMLNHYQRLIEFRNDHPVLATGEIEFLDQGKKVVAFERSKGNKKLRVYHNLSGQEQKVEVKSGQVIFTAPNKSVEANEGNKGTAIVAIPAYTSVVIK